MSNTESRARAYLGQCERRQGARDFSGANDVEPLYWDVCCPLKCDYVVLAL